MNNAEKSEQFGWIDLAKSVWYLMDKKRKVFLFWFIGLIVINFYSIVPPLILGKIIDFFTGFKDGQTLLPFIILASTLGLSYSAVSFIRLSIKKALGNLRTEITYLIKVRGFENLLNYSIQWHDGENTGAKVKKIENGTSAYKSIMGSLIYEVVQSSTAFIGIVSVFLFLNPKYIVFFVGYVIIFFLILTFFYKKIKVANDDYNKLLEGAGGSYVEGLSNILTIKTLGAGESFKSHIAKKEELAKEHEFYMRNLGNSLWKTFQAFNGICYGLFLYIVGIGVVAGEVSTGSIVIFYGYLAELTGNANRILNIYEEIISNKSSIGRMMPIIMGKTDQENGTKVFPKDWDTISLKNINFSYTQTETDQRLNLNDINISIKRFEKIGLVGKTGSGKSTLSKILVGLYKIDSGEYKIGDTNFYDISNLESSKKIALVLQDSEMFNLSLKENITLLKNVPNTIFEKAVEISQLRDVIKKLPEGLDTLIGEKGYHLSGGERQRVGIARAICKNPDILIFDEATSSLDSKTEKSVHEAIESELESKTIIIIAHRIATLKNVNTIYVFKNGKVVESGTFEELTANKDSEFSSIHNLQSK